MVVRKNEKANVFILHSLNGDTLEFWGKTLKWHLTNEGVEVLMPEFPIREQSTFEKFDKILSYYLDNKILNENSIVVCHSVANPYFIKFCREHNFAANAFIAVAPGMLYEDLSTRADYVVEVKKQAYLTKKDFAYAPNLKNVYCLYSDEDDKPDDYFQRFVDAFNAKPMYLMGYDHFGGRHRIYYVPELHELIDDLI